MGGWRICDEGEMCRGRKREVVRGRCKHKEPPLMKLELGVCFNGGLENLVI